MKLIKEELDNLNLDIETKARETVNPVYADAIRQLKVNDEKREAARKLPATPKTEEPKPIKNELLKKMHLSESLFEDTDNITKSKPLTVDMYNNIYDLLRRSGYRVYAPIGDKIRVSQIIDPNGHRKTYNYDKAIKILDTHNIAYKFIDGEKPFIYIMYDGTTNESLNEAHNLSNSEKVKRVLARYMKDTSIEEDLNKTSTIDKTNSIASKLTRYLDTL